MEKACGGRGDRLQEQDRHGQLGLPTPTPTTGGAAMKKVFTTGQVARICRVRAATVAKWFDSGRLQGYRIPGSQDRRIPRDYLIRFLKEHGMPLGELEEEQEEREDEWTDSAPVPAPQSQEGAVQGRQQRERGLALACGLTEPEADCWIAVEEVARRFVVLPVLHDMDAKEVLRVLAFIRSKLMARPAQRRYQEELVRQGRQEAP
jgi:excisionase family DNA binding protein